MSKEVEQKLKSLENLCKKRRVNNFIEISLDLFKDVCVYETKYSINVKFNGKGMWEHHLRYKGVLYITYSDTGLSVGDL